MTTTLSRNSPNSSALFSPRVSGGTGSGSKTAVQGPQLSRITTQQPLAHGVPVTKATTPGALSAYHHGHRVLYDPVMTLHESVSRNDGLSPTLSQMSNLLRVTFSRFSYNALASCVAGVQLPLASHICHTYIHTSPGLPTITTPSLVPILKSYIIYSIQ